MDLNVLNVRLVIIEVLLHLVVYVIQVIMKLIMKLIVHNVIFNVRHVMEGQTHVLNVKLALVEKLPEIAYVKRDIIK